MRCCPGNAKVQPSNDTGVAPSAKRHCTDILFLLLFVAAFIVSLICMSVGLDKGDPARLLYGTDYMGNACGGKNNPSSKKTIYYPRLDQDLVAAMQSGGSAADAQPYGICVNACPPTKHYICNTEGMEKLANEVGEKPTSNIFSKSDKFGQKIENKGMVDSSWQAKGPCWRVDSPSKPFFFRCLPYDNQTSYTQTFCLGDDGTSRLKINSTEDRWEYNGTAPVPRVDKTSGTGYRWKNKQVQGKTYPSDCTPTGGVKDSKGCKDLESAIVPNFKCQTTMVLKSSETPAMANQHEGDSNMQNPMIEQLKTFSARVGRWMGDIEATAGDIMIFGAALALGFGLVWLVLLKYCAKVMVWMTLWITIIALIALTLYSAVRGDMIGDTSNTFIGDTSSLQSEMSDGKSGENEDAFKVLTYVSLVLTIIMFIVILFMRKQIKVSIGIIREASNAIKRMPLLLVFPIIPFALTIAVVLYFLYVGAAIYSANDLQATDLAETASASMAEATTGFSYDVNITIASNSTLKDLNVKHYMLAYHLFFSLWLNQLVAAISMCTIAGAVCKYYWSRSKNSEPVAEGGMGKRPIAASFWNCFRYHFGSLALGSLIIAIVQFIRFCLSYIDRKTKNLQESNFMIKLFMKIIKCCMWCLEKCLKFISRNAYIMVAMEGSSFCSSAVKAFTLILANVGQVGVISMITGALLTFAKITICAGCGFFMIAALDQDKYQEGGENELSAPMLPVLLTLFVSYFVSGCFLYVYELAVDTILLAFCQDRKVNEGGGHVFMSDELARYIGVEKKVPEEVQKIDDAAPEAEA